MNWLLIGRVGGHGVVWFRFAGQVEAVGAAVVKIVYFCIVHCGEDVGRETHAVRQYARIQRWVVAGNYTVNFSIVDADHEIFAGQIRR